MADMNQQEQ